MIKAAVSAARFWWKATAGYRLRPWLSPYLRWRVETYTGKPAGTLRLKDFVAMAIAERRQLVHFFAWTGDLHKIANGKKL